MKNMKVSVRNKKKKSDNMVVNDMKIYQRMKNKSLLSIKKVIINEKKTPYYNYKKLLF